MMFIMVDDIISNFESLSEAEISQYSGKWIAVVDGKVVVNGNSFKEVYNFAKNNFPRKRALIGKLPKALLSIVTL